MPTIGIDCRFAATQSGHGRYTREMVTHLLSRHDQIHYVLFVRSASEEWLKALEGNPTVIEVDIPHYSLAEQLRLPGILRKAKIDLLFSPHFNVPFFCPVPTVITVHDLILHRYPNRASWLKQAVYRILQYRALRKALCIIAVSEFTRSEIAYFYGPAITKRVTTVLEGVSADFHRRSEQEQTEVRRKYHLLGPFFLYVGNAKEHKNVPMLLAAYRDLHDRSVELILLCHGKEAERLSLPPGARRLSHVDDVDLPALYSSARAFVTASLYEGFGLPVVEAEACGCPVIATLSASIPEVASDTAVLVAPNRDALSEALRQTPLPRPRPRVYDWKITAEKTAEVLREALE